MFDRFRRADFHAEPCGDDHLNVLLPVYFSVFRAIIVTKPERTSVSIVSEGVDVIAVVVGFHTWTMFFIAKNSILYLKLSIYKFKNSIKGYQGKITYKAFPCSRITP